MDTLLNNKVTERKTCRLCEGELRIVIDLGDLSISTFTENTAEVPAVPMTLMRCVDCDLVQLKHTIDGTVMYTDYWYKSGLNKSMVAALKDVVDRIMEFNPKREIWIDIGSNDNTMLNYVQKTFPDFETVGFDPTKIERLKVDNFFNGFFSADEYFSYFNDDERASVVTAIACFYDMEDPRKFVEDVKRVLDKDGIFVIQMMDLWSMWKTHDFANICHEHLEYYSLGVLNKFMESMGLTIFHVEYNDVNGGSLRTYIKFAENDTIAINPSVAKYLSEEWQWFASLGEDPYMWFSAKVETIKRKTVDFIRKQVELGKKVAVFGASTKGNTILQVFGLDHTVIDHAAEVNPDKYGLLTVATHIPIISQQESLHEKTPDYYFVLPHGFIHFFVQEHESFLRNGGKFIVALPQPAVISWDVDEAVWNYL